MLDTGFFMTMGGLGVSLAGFGGLFSALHHGDSEMEPEVYRWRMREIVTSSFLLAFLGFGVVVVHGFTDDLAATARIISALALLAGIARLLTSAKPGPAWPSETDRKGAIGGSTVVLAVIAGNVFAGSQNYLRIVMLLLLLTPALVFIRATVDATASGSEAAALDD
jgi:cation transporter-like permease